MASIYLDKQSRNWKVKTLDNGRDKRVTIRKAKPGESSKPIPDDVVVQARRQGFVFSTGTKIDTPVFAIETQDGHDNAPDDLMAFLGYYLDDYGQTHRPGSIKRMTGIIAHFRRFLTTLDNAPKLVSRVTEQTIMAWFHWRRDQRDARLQITLKPWVVVGETELLSGLFRLAVDRGLIPVNPAKRPLDKLRKAHPKPDPADETKFIESEELGPLLKSIDTAVNDGKVPLDYADLARVMLATGLRVEAALHLEYSWIGAKDWTVKVPAEFDKCRTGYTTVVARSGQSVLIRRRGLEVAGRVFPPHMTQAMSYYYLRRMGHTNHKLRHSFATALVDEGVSIQTIGSLLGHKHIQTTQRYAKVRESAKVDAVSKLNFGT